jgi:tetratricopeptide (TPR) repeat protein
MRNVRVALCQLESHPAIYGGHVAFAEEPFVPLGDRWSLSRLGNKGIDVQKLQDYCRAEYLKWSDARLRSVVAFLRTIQPPPDLVLFPEGAVPLESIGHLKELSGSVGVTVLAGTHTPLSNPAALRAYAMLGVSATQRKAASKALGGSVLPMIRNGKVALLPKRLPSPFERTDIAGPDPEVLDVKAYTIQTKDGGLEMLPLVCIEALRLQSVTRPYAVACIVSYDARPEQFQPFIDQQVRNRKPVLYCNDGHFGGTRIGVVQDQRMPSWLRDTFPEGLPPGDSVLVFDIDLDATVVEVGTAVPRASHRLVVLGSIVGEHSRTAVVSRELSEVVGQLPGGIRAERLERLVHSSAMTPLQEARVRHLRDLERRGLPSEDWWKALGFDCVVAGQENLDEFEARLAAVCRDSLTGVLTSAVARRPDIAPFFLEYYTECATRGRGGPQTSAALPGIDPSTVVDREAEAKNIAEFVDNQAAIILEVSGLPQIGKSSVLEKGLTQAGVSRIFRMALSATSSPDYVVYSILKLGSGLPNPPYTDPVEVIRSAGFANVLRTLQVIVFERAHLLTDFGVWRDERFGPLFSALTDVATSLRVKIILETQRELPIEIQNPSTRQRLRVAGLNKNLRPFGEALFDAQLRRIGLSPEAVAGDVKAAIVERLGGHPVAVALAADTSYGEGADSVLDALKRRQGFYLNFLQVLLRSLSLTDDDHTTLRLLGLARRPVDRTALMGAVPFAGAPVLRNLISLGAIEVSRDGRIEIAGILREYFDPRELEPDVVSRFHRAAATAFQAAVERDPRNLEAAVEAEYHGGIVGLKLTIDSKVFDGALATADERYRAQQYDAAAVILGMLLQKHRTIDVVRLAALVAARRNRPDDAIALAKEALTRNPKDSRLVADLAKISLSQYQDDRTTTKLVEIARRVGVENVSLLVVEGRMFLRHERFLDAERVFQRARQLTRFNPWPFYYLGVTYQRMGRLQDAIDVLEDGQEFFYNSESRSRNALNAIRTKLGLAYLFAEDTDSAARILEPLFEEDPSNPEVIRAYAALTIRRDGVQQAQKAFERLNEASIRSKFDRCQFHLFYGLFYLGIDSPHEAVQEFAKAHASDRSNVYVMIKWAHAVFEIAKGHYADGEDVYKAYVADCQQLVRMILRFDPDNGDGVELLQALYRTFGVTVGEEAPAAETPRP